MKLTVSHSQYPSAYFTEICLTKVEADKNQWGHDFLKIHFKAKAASAGWTKATLTGIKQLPGQASLDYSLNPSDHYFLLEARAAKGIGTGFRSSLPEIEFELEFTPQPVTTSIVHHLSFHNGMAAGIWRWLLYKLDITRLDDVKFEFVKRYAYIQGQSRHY